MRTLFEILNLFVVPVWVLAIVAPRSRLSLRVLASPLVVAAPVLVYAALVMPRLATILPIVARPELDAVVRLLGNPLGTTIGWAHFLAFDLWVGRFIVLDAERRALAGEAALPRPVLSLILALTLLLGPLGLAAYGISCAKPLQRLRSFLALSAEGSPVLTRLGVVSMLVGLASVSLQAFDARQLAGVSVWLKPAKFGVSIAIVTFTLALLLRVIALPAKTRRRAIGAVGFFTALELAIITLQAARGVPSHFNAQTLFDNVMFQVMGVGITLVTIAFAFVAWHALRTQYENRALGSGIRSGLAIMMFGSMLAFLMVRPTASQLETLTKGQPTPAIGAHSVGSPDGAEGLPVTRWNTRAGDLRIPHFIGLHALQVLPLVGLYLGRRRGVSAALALRLTRIAAAGYLGVVLTTLLQALRGQPLLAADALTLVVLGVVAAASISAALAALFAERRGQVARSGAPLMAAGRI